MRYLVSTSVLYLRFHSLTSRRSGRIKDLGYNYRSKVTRQRSLWFFEIGFDRANNVDFRILDRREIPGVFALAFLLGHLSLFEKPLVRRVALRFGLLFWTRK
ncbi:hypothetical protein VTL71DRAFT_2342 [Oculimacula yallundae]|uniref:Uncharacterized protein n=1 Tax=Oculimacula yallundae TaxID=86028 RepID=A0ABR4CAJ3_9HELO